MTEAVKFWEVSGHLMDLSDLGLEEFETGGEDKLSSDGGRTALPSELSGEEFLELLDDVMTWRENPRDDIQRVGNELLTYLGYYGHSIGASNKDTEKCRATTIGAIAKQWSSDPKEWGMCGTADIIFDPATVARFRWFDGQYMLDVFYVDDQQWRATGVQAKFEDIDWIDEERSEG